MRIGATTLVQLVEADPVVIVCIDEATGTEFGMYAPEATAIIAGAWPSHVDRFVGPNKVAFVEALKYFLKYM
jgi:hypothetical protein